MKKLVGMALVLALGGCSGFQSRLTAFDAGVKKYAPIIGRDLIMIGNDILLAECSPILSPATQVVDNVLAITAQSLTAAQRVIDVLAVNSAIAEQLCPLVTSIRASVGKVPVGTPSQVIKPAIVTK